MNSRLAKPSHTHHRNSSSVIRINQAVLRRFSMNRFPIIVFSLWSGSSITYSDCHILNHTIRAAVYQSFHRVSLWTSITASRMAQLCRDVSITGIPSQFSKHLNFCSPRHWYWPHHILVCGTPYHSKNSRRCILSSGLYLDLRHVSYHCGCYVVTHF